MSSKMLQLSVNPLQSQTVNTLNALMAQEDADRKFQLQMIREDRRDALARARMNLEDKRYEQDRADKIAMLSATTPLIATDTMSNETKLDKSADNIITDYDTDKLNKDASSVPVIGALDKKEIDPFKKKLLDSYDNIMNDTKKSDLQKKLDIRNLMKNNGYADALKEEDGFGTGIVKGIGKTLSYAEDIADLVPNIFNSPEMNLAQEKKIANAKKKRDDYYAIEDPVGDFRAEMEGIRRDIKFNEDAQEKYNAELANQQAFLEKYKTKKTYGDKTVETPTLKSYNTYAKDVQAEADKLYREVDSLNISPMAKALRKKSISDEVNRKLTEYQTDRKFIRDTQTELTKESLKQMNKIQLEQIKQDNRIEVEAAKARLKELKPDSIEYRSKLAEIKKKEAYIKKVNAELD